MSATATEFSNVLVNAHKVVFLTKNDIFQGTAIKHLVNEYKSLEECLRMPSTGISLNISYLGNYI